MTIPQTVRAVVVHVLGQPLSIEEPPPGPGEVLVRIMASGACPTDLQCRTVTGRIVLNRD